MRNKKFEILELIAGLEPVQFIGLARIMGAKLLQEESKEETSFTDLLQRILERFERLNRKKKREILEMLRQCVKENKREKKKELTESKRDKEATISAYDRGDCSQDGDDR